MNSKMWLRIQIVIIVALGTFSETVTAQERTLFVAPRFETYCSRTVPGNSQVELQWAVAPKGVESKDFAAATQQQVLDVTVYKEGFRRGLYKTIKPGAETPEFHLFGAQEGKEIPGLQKLRLTEFVTSRHAPKQGLRMMARPMPEHESGIAKLEGLEPGMKYFIRISSPGFAQQMLSFNAAICPADYVKPPKRK